MGKTTQHGQGRTDTPYLLHLYLYRCCKPLCHTSKKPKYGQKKKTKKKKCQKNTKGGEQGRTGTGLLNEEWRNEVGGEDVRKEDVI